MRGSFWCVLLVGLLVGGFLIPVVVSRQVVVAATEDQVFMVELIDRGAMISLRRNLREYEARVRAVSSRAPKHYVVGDDSRLAQDVRRWVSVTVPVSHAEEVRQVLERQAIVVSVTPERLYEAAVSPNDPYFPEQYGLSSLSSPLADIGAPAAWEKTTGSPSIIIAIIDGGVDLAHEDLRDKIWVNSDEVAGNGVDDDANGYIDDAYGWDFVSNVPAATSMHHATHVAGIAGAAANNATGGAGVDWGARLMSVRVLSNSGVGREENIIRGIEYAVANGARVINLSIAGPASEALLDAVENAYAAGVVVVAAAGNERADTGWLKPMPACAEVGGINMVIGVGATDEDGEPATSFSNYGACVDVSAPGKSILSTKLGNQYGEMTGTSMSAPFVAGAAGLYLSLHSNASPSEVIGAIVNTRTAFTGSDVERVATWNQRYKGLLDLAAVVGGGSSTVNPSPTPEASSGGSDSGGGGGDSGGGGGGGGGGDSGGEPEVAAKPKPRVAGATTVHPKANVALLKRVKLTFNYVFGRHPTAAERLYWDTRIKKGEKRTYEALLGAMQYQKSKGLTAGPQIKR